MDVKGKIIETKRLSLRFLDESYAETILDFFNRNRGFLKKWEPSKDDIFYTLEYQRSLLEVEQAKMGTGEMFKVWLFKKDNYEKAIGSIAFNNIIRGGFHSCFLGYRMDKGETNMGYMTEALGAFVGFGFNELMLHRIEANVMPHNLPSLRVLAKLGFYNEGLAKKYLKINGEWEDHIHMVLLNEDV